MSNDITPALYAFAEELAFRVVEENAPVLREFLERERLLYEAVFKGFVLGRALRSGKRTMRDFFCDYLHNEGIIKVSKTWIDELSPPIHNEYWQLAEDDRFWSPGKREQLDGLLDHGELIHRWCNDRRQRLENLALLLDRFKGVLRS